MYKKDDRKCLLIRYKIDKEGHVSFIDPRCDEIPVLLFSKAMKALSDVEKEWNAEIDNKIDLKEYIEIKSFVVVNPNFPVITKKSALKAVAMAEEEMKRKAIEVLSSVLDNWVHGGDADCIIAEFEERLNKEKI